MQSVGSHTIPCFGILMPLSLDRALSWLPGFAVHSFALYQKKLKIPSPFGNGRNSHFLFADLLETGGTAISFLHSLLHSFIGSSIAADYLLLRHSQGGLLNSQGPDNPKTERKEKNLRLVETGGTAISFLLTFWKRAEQPFPFCTRCFIYSFVLNQLQPEYFLRQENTQALATWLCAGIQSPVLTCHTTNLPHLSLLQGELATIFQQRACVPQN